jgi:hypothetical protein
MDDFLEWFYTWGWALLIILLLFGMVTYFSTNPQFFNNNNKCKELGYNKYNVNYRESPVPYCYKVVNGQLLKYYIEDEK